MQETHSSAKRAIYSFRFAESVVDSFIEKYARATIFVCKKCNIKGNAFRYGLIKAFMYNQTRWKVLREMIKYVEKHDLVREWANLPVDQFPYYLTFVRTTCEDYLIDNQKL